MPARARPPVRTRILSNAVTRAPRREEAAHREQQKADTGHHGGQPDPADPRHAQRFRLLRLVGIGRLGLAGLDLDHLQRLEVVAAPKAHHRIDAAER
jgi:hypothetical protein